MIDPRGQVAAAPARLELEDGTVFAGRACGLPKSVAGEVVFNTGMVGYPEALTDPSYRGQILVLTYPLVGNYGVPAAGAGRGVAAFESGAIQVAALVVSELTDACSHHSAARTLPQWLREEGIPCLAGVDTRALTQHLRDRGCLPGRIVVAGDAVAFSDPSRDNLVAAVSVRERVVHPGGRSTVVVVDCGCKASLIDALRERDLTVIRVPWDHDFLDEDFDGVFVSNGPGDPTACAPTIRNIARALQRKRPVMGVCLGHQLVALAAGARTYKLKFGHRGHNQPCLEAGSRRCYITSQNHGYAVDAASLPREWQPWFTNANDGSNEGIRHRTAPFFGVQFHPEGAPGPIDGAHLFDHFVGAMR